MAANSLSVVVCARNEEARIARALQSVLSCKPDEVLLVDGQSTDSTADIARKLGVKVIPGTGRGLTADRQLGADRAKGHLVSYIDADHRPKPGDLDALVVDLAYYGLDVVQSGVGIEDNGFWCRAENDAMIVFQHKPGPRKQMIGTAPTVFRKEVLETVRFDESKGLQSDDADLCRRIVETGRYTFGVGRTVIPQEHHGSFSEYVSKFRWYGRRDAAFMMTHKSRIHSMLFHLLVRYPIWRPIKAAIKGRPRAMIYFWVCGSVRLYACSGELLRRFSTKISKNLPFRPRKAAT